MKKKKKKKKTYMKRVLSYNKHFNSSEINKSVKLLILVIMEGGILVIPLTWPIFQKKTRLAKSLMLLPL